MGSKTTTRERKDTFSASREKQTDAAFRQFFNIGADGKRDTGRDTQMTRERQAKRTKSEADRLRGIANLKKRRQTATGSELRNLTRLQDRLERAAPTISKNPFSREQGRAKSFEASMRPVFDDKGNVIGIKSNDPRREDSGAFKKDKKTKTIITPTPTTIVEENIDVTETAMTGRRRTGRRSKRFGGAASDVETLIS
tara:strand:- start:961 stop:1551 length:591 start_codon:yes stop_codon:yes gene_type:complete